MRLRFRTRRRRAQRRAPWRGRGEEPVHPECPPRKAATRHDLAMAFSRPSPRRPRRAARVAGLGALCAAVLAPVAHAAPATIATEQRATPVAAWAGTVAWSSYDAATNDYHLVVSRNGAAPHRPPIAASPNAFDVDLGTNRSGSTYAVYSRCTTPPTQNTHPTGGHP